MNISASFTKLRNLMRAFAQQSETEWLKREAMRITLSEINHSGWESRVDELMNDPSLQQQAKQAMSPIIAAIEDQSLLTELGIHEEEHPSSGKPN